MKEHFTLKTVSENLIQLCQCHRKN